MWCATRSGSPCHFSVIVEQGVRANVDRPGMTIWKWSEDGVIFRKFARIGEEREDFFERADELLRRSV